MQTHTHSQPCTHASATLNTVFSIKKLAGQSLPQPGFVFGGNEWWLSKASRRLNEQAWGGGRGGQHMVLHQLIWKCKIIRKRDHTHAPTHGLR